MGVEGWGARQGWRCTHPEAHPIGQHALDALHWRLLLLALTAVLFLGILWPCSLHLLALFRLPFAVAGCAMTHGLNLDILWPCQPSQSTCCPSQGCCHPGSVELSALSHFIAGPPHVITSRARPATSGTGCSGASQPDHRILTSRRSGENMAASRGEPSEVLFVWGAFSRPPRRPPSGGGERPQRRRGGIRGDPEGGGEGGWWLPAAKPRPPQPTASPSPRYHLPLPPHTCPLPLLPYPPPPPAWCHGGGQDAPRFCFGGRRRPLDAHLCLPPRGGRGDCDGRSGGPPPRGGGLCPG